MVGRLTAGVSCKINFLRSVMAFHELGRGLIRHPVAVGQHPVSVHLPAWRHKHMVDAAVGVQIGVKGVERAVFGKAQA